MRTVGDFLMWLGQRVCSHPGFVRTSRNWPTYWKCANCRLERWGRFVA